jgi:hypothetical protein
MSVTSQDNAKDAGHAFEKNTIEINGIQRIRKFNVSYLGTPVCDVSDVIETLPTRVTSWDPERSARKKGFVTPNEDGIYTVTDSTSTSGAVSEAASAAGRKRQRTRKARAVATQRTTGTNLRTQFTHIRVHDTGRRLGKFETNLEFAPADPVVLEYLLSPEGSVTGFDPESWCFMLSCGEVQMAHLKMYDIPVIHAPDFATLDDPDEGRRAMCRAVDMIQDMLQLEELLPELWDLSMDEVRYDPSKSSGAYYRLQGYKTRGEVADVAREEARQATIALLKGLSVAHRPTRIGGRGKPINRSQKQAEDEGLRKGRAIHMTDTRDGFILGLTEQQLNDAWKDKRFPISVGRGWFHGDATDFVRRAVFAARFKCFDAEKFDSSLMPYLIHIAVTICRMQFERGLDTEFDQYWLFVEESLLHSFVYRDDGVMFEKWIGTSSGHNHNSLMQSIVTLLLAAFNAFYANHSLSDEVIRANLFIEGLGDDNMYAETEVLKEESVDVVGKRIWGVFNVSWLGSKSFESNSVIEAFVQDCDFDEERMFGGAQYLGKYFRRWPIEAIAGEIKFTAIPYRPLIETVVRMLYPEKAARQLRFEESTDYYDDKRGGRWAGHILDGSGNPHTRDWLYGLHDYCLMNGHECEVAVPKKMIARWKRMGVEIDVENVNWDEFGFEDWLSLVSYQKGVGFAHL